MKKLFLFPVMLLFALTITACSNSPNGFEEPETEQPETPGNDGDEDNKPEDNSMKIKITVGNREVTATMKDNVTARDFLSRLPAAISSCFPFSAKCCRHCRFRRIGFRWPPPDS